MLATRPRDVLPFRTPGEWAWPAYRYPKHEKTIRRIGSDRGGSRRFGVGRFGAGVGNRPTRARPRTVVSLVSRRRLPTRMGLELRLVYLPRRPSPRYRRLRPQSRRGVGLWVATAGTKVGTGVGRCGCQGASTTPAAPRNLLHRDVKRPNILRADPDEGYDERPDGP
jgi:hypothetical protein